MKICHGSHNELSENIEMMKIEQELNMLAEKVTVAQFIYIITIFVNCVKFMAIFRRFC